jgi:hypothetical protein
MGFKTSAGTPIMLNFQEFIDTALAGMLLSAG